MRNCFNCFSVDLKEGMTPIEINQATGENVENLYCHLAKLELDWEIVRVLNEKTSHPNAIIKRMF